MKMRDAAEYGSLIDPLILTALSDAVKDLNNQTRVADKTSLSLEAYLPALERFGLALFNAVAEGIAADCLSLPEYLSVLNAHASPRIIDAIIPEYHGLRETLQPSSDALRGRELHFVEGADGRMDLFVSPRQSPACTSPFDSFDVDRESAPVPASAETHAIFMAYGLWEKHAPEEGRFVLRYHSDPAREVLRRTFRARIPHWTARFTPLATENAAPVDGPGQAVQPAVAGPERGSNALPMSTPEQLATHRQELLGAAKARWGATPFSWIHKAANVDYKEATLWKNGKLPDSSVMSIRIEVVLARPDPPVNPNPT
jgi:hypothetical protein